MKILHIIASVDPASGGPIQGVLNQGLVSQNAVRREIVSLDPPDAAYLKGYPVPVYPMGVAEPTTKAPIWRRYGFTPRLIPWLRQNVTNYDLVVVNGIWNFTTMAAARILPKGRVPYVVFTHGMLDPWFQENFPVKRMGKQLSWFFNEGPLINNASGVLFTSEDERVLARGQYTPYHPVEKVIGYGTYDDDGDPAVQAAAFRAACPEVGDRRFLLFLSRIHPKKGCDLLVSAFAKVAASVPDLDLVIAGPDQTGWVKDLKAQAEQLGVADSIHWPGMLKGDQKWGAFRECEAFVLPSHQENFGIVVAEAMACNKPVLLTDKVNIWREVEACGGGIAEPDTEAGVERLLTRFIAMTPDQVAAMGRHARLGFEQSFDMRTNAAKLLTTFQEFIR